MKKAISPQNGRGLDKCLKCSLPGQSSTSGNKARVSWARYSSLVESWF